MVEDLGGTQSMWQLPLKSRHLSFDETRDPASLGDLLDGASKMRPKEKLRLSLTLAHSLLLYHDSPWLSRGWKKEKVFFFFQAGDVPDYGRPYLSFRFNAGQLDPVQEDDHMQPPNENILALGIILLEIHEEKPIERWHNRKDNANLHAFTDWEVAKRVVERIDCNGTQAAIKQYLEWVRYFPGDASLEEHKMRTELYRRVIWPRERDLALLRDL